MKATCRRCGVTVEPERPNDRLALHRLMESHVCELRFDAEDPDTWLWLVLLLGGTERAAICGECGFVWPTGCHLTEGLAHLDSEEHQLAEKMLAHPPQRA